tara:strand:- start:2249 stop:2401 length:153 start_codon:yes stop_codon:yes gene_type:complete
MFLYFTIIIFGSVSSYFLGIYEKAIMQDLSKYELDRSPNEVVRFDNQGSD